MTAINPNIDVSYPLPGQNNSSQGFRDNFTAINSAFSTANVAINDLENKAILKSALNGTQLDNDMNNNLILNAQTLGFRASTYNLGTNLIGTVDVDCTVGDVQYGTIVSGTGSISLTFSKWAPSGTQASVQLILTVNPGDVINLPDSVSIGSDTIENFDASTNSLKVPANTTLIHYNFTTTDCGTTIEIQPANRPRVSTQVINRTPTLVGLPGDSVGAIAYGGSTFWICSANYDGHSSIWSTINSSGGGSSNYGNANVAAYLPTYNGNLGNVAGITASANINGTNLILSGRANISGDINATSGNISSAGTITASGNITAANFNTTGDLTVNDITATGTITFSTGSTITVPGTITGGNLITTGNANVGALKVSGTSNLGPVANVTITGGTSGQVLTTNGSNVLSWTTVSGGGGTYGDSNVATYLPTYGGNLQGGNLNINSNATIGSRLTATTGTFTGTLSAGQITSTGNITTSTQLNAQSVLTSGALTVNGSANITSGNLWVGGRANIGSTLWASQDATVVGTLTAGNITTTGTISAANIVTTGTGPVSITSSSTILLTTATGASVNTSGNLKIGGNSIYTTPSTITPGVTGGIAGQIVVDIGNSKIWVCMGGTTWKSATLS